MIWIMPISLPSLTERGKNTLVDHLGIEFTEIGDNFLAGTMPVDKRTHQPLGIMHGGASCVLAETMGSMAANYCVDQATHYCVGLDINTNHIRSIRSGLVTAIAKPFHMGRTTQVWGIEIFDEQKKMISVTRLTLAVLSKG